MHKLDLMVVLCNYSTRQFNTINRKKRTKRLRDKNDNNSTIVTEQEDGADKIYYLDFAYNFVATTENMTDEKFYKKLSNYIIKQERENSRRS